MDRRRTLIAATALSLAVVTAANHPVARFEIVTHDLSDPAPRRFQAVADLGMMGVSVLVTWTADRLTR